MKNISLIILFCLTSALYSCGTIKEGFTNQKKKSSDEFLVEKKSPLIMPPDYDELPIPKTNKYTVVWVIFIWENFGVKKVPVKIFLQVC